MRKIPQKLIVCQIMGRGIDRCKNLKLLLPSGLEIKSVKFDNAHLMRALRSANFSQVRAKRLKCP